MQASFLAHKVPRTSIRYSLAVSVIWCAIIPVIRHKEKEKEVTHRILLLCFFDGSMEYLIVLKSYCKLTKCINFGGLWSRCWAGL